MVTSKTAMSARNAIVTVVNAYLIINQLALRVITRITCYVKAHALKRNAVITTTKAKKHVNTALKVV